MTGQYIVHRGGVKFTVRGPLADRQEAETRVYFEGDGRRWVWRDSAVFFGSFEECVLAAKAMNGAKEAYQSACQVLSDRYEAQIKAIARDMEALR